MKYPRVDEEGKGLIPHAVSGKVFKIIRKQEYRIREIVSFFLLYKYKK